MNLDGLVNAPDYRSRLERCGLEAYLREEGIAHLVDDARATPLATLPGTRLAAVPVDGTEIALVRVDLETFPTCDP